MIGSPEYADRVPADQASSAPEDAASDEPASPSSESTSRPRESAPDGPDGADGPDAPDDVGNIDGDDIGRDAELTVERGPDPLRFNRWMKRSTTGAVLTGVTIGLQQALEKRDQRPAFIIEAPGEPEDDEPLVRLQFDPDNPSKTVAVVRADAGHDRAPSPHADTHTDAGVDEPEGTEPDR